MGTHYQGTRAEVRALDAYIKLQRAADSVRSRLERRLLGHGLTESQFGVLETLYHLGPLHQREIGRKLFTSGANITVIVDNLERRGLARRERGTDDRRFVTVHLTEVGRALVAQIFPGHVALLVELLAALEPAEQEELGRLCKTLGLFAARSGEPRSGPTLPDPS